ncbi:hypothetical protein BELL_0185g00120 [Botrytis elliptica]|uniref:NmrA-like domain-containing protein n=1 Tax=Botrytis elliptica TaxID=278938 RepID=A0A4Z1K3P6_9HELO|nr:hypothetical protein BELL_0185g00120 [Botrytis elliptica]
MSVKRKVPLAWTKLSVTSYVSIFSINLAGGVQAVTLFSKRGGNSDVGLKVASLGLRNVRFTIIASARPGSKYVESPVTAFAKQGVQMVAALKGTHSDFLVTNYWETATPGVERSQGTTVADAPKATCISHLIYSSLLNASKATNGRLKEVKHFDEKADIEEHIRTSRVPCSFFLPGYFMANYTFMIHKEGDGSYVLASPVS